MDRDGRNCVFGGDVDQEADVVRDVILVIESRVGVHGHSRFKIARRWQRLGQEGETPARPAKLVRR